MTQLLNTQQPPIPGGMAYDPTNPRQAVLQWLRMHGQAANPFNPASMKYVNMLAGGMIPQFVHALGDATGSDQSVPTEFASFLDKWMQQGGAQGGFGGAMDALKGISGRQQRLSQWAAGAGMEMPSDPNLLRGMIPDYVSKLQEQGPTSLADLVSLGFIDPEAQKGLYLNAFAPVLGGFAPGFNRAMEPVFEGYEGLQGAMGGTGPLAFTSGLDWMLGNISGMGGGGQPGAQPPATSGVPNSFAPMITGGEDVPQPQSSAGVQSFTDMQPGVSMGPAQEGSRSELFPGWNLLPPEVQRLLWSLLNQQVPGGGG